jgi:hypothetical protein
VYCVFYADRNDVLLYGWEKSGCKHRGKKLKNKFKIRSKKRGKKSKVPFTSILLVTHGFFYKKEFLIVHTAFMVLMPCNFWSFFFLVLKSWC